MSLIFLLLMVVVIFVSIILIVFSFTSNDTQQLRTEPFENNIKKFSYKKNGIKPYNKNIERVPYTPKQLMSTYKKPSTVLSGENQKIVIITAFKYNDINKDLKKFCNTYNINYKPMKIHDLGNNINKSSNDWSVETCMDTQWATVFAPKAIIEVVAAESDSVVHMTNALDYAVNNIKPNIVSMSWGTMENGSIIQKMENIFEKNKDKIIFMAASGDWMEVSYPSSSPNVISVGGTRLYVTEDGEKRGETDWALPNGWGTGHGLSKFFKRPTYQNGSNSSEYRSTPDISCIGATPSGNGVSVYNTFNGGFLGVYGTSLSCPILAGIIATINTLRNVSNKKNLTKNEILSHLYSLKPSNSNTWPVDTMADGVGYVNNMFIDFLASK